MSLLGHARLVFVATAMVGLIAGSPGVVRAFSSSSTERPLFTTGEEKADPPPGWAAFCSQYVSECQVKPGSSSSVPRTVVFTRAIWQSLYDVNKWANLNIAPLTDTERQGRENVWSFAEDGRGDCKEYVLVKRQKLIELGWPPESLLITIVWTQQDQGHAVLIARTDQGDFVLDNLSAKVLIWSETGYEYIERQSQLDPNIWVYIDGHPPLDGDIWIAHGLI